MVLRVMPEREQTLLPELAAEQAYHKPAPDRARHQPPYGVRRVRVAVMVCVTGPLMGYNWAAPPSSCCCCQEQTVQNGCLWPSTLLSQVCCRYQQLYG